MRQLGDVALESMHFILQCTYLATLLSLLLLQRVCALLQFGDLHAETLFAFAYTAFYVRAF